MQAIVQIDQSALQNLAWLHPDGHVVVPANHHLRGASAPRLENLQLDLQSLAAANSFNGMDTINLSNLHMIDAGNSEPYVPVQLQNLEAQEEPTT